MNVTKKNENEIRKRLVSEEDIIQTEWNEDT